MKISVITVCRNAGDRIDATASSLAIQAGVTFEWIVVDGASTDDTVQRVEGCRVKIGSSLVRVLSEPDHGIYDAMNKGLGMARGEWMMFLNAGDELADNGALAALVSRAADGVALVTGVTRMRDERDGFTVDAGGEFAWKNVGRGRVPPHPGCVYRCAAAVAAGGYDESMGLAADTALTLRVAGAGTVVHVPRVVTLYPMDGISSRFDWSWRVHRDKARAIRAAAPAWVWRRYRWRWPVEALRATASHLLRKCGLLGVWRRIKRAL